MRKVNAVVIFVKSAVYVGGMSFERDIPFFAAIGGLHQTVLRSKTDAMRSERTKLIQ